MPTSNGFSSHRFYSSGGSLCGERRFCGKNTTAEKKRSNLGLLQFMSAHCDFEDYSISFRHVSPELLSSG
jgi:hypothetical protein